MVNPTDMTEWIAERRSTLAEYGSGESVKIEAGERSAMVDLIEAKARELSAIGAVFGIDEKSIDPDRRRAIMVAAIEAARSEK